MEHRPTSPKQSRVVVAPATIPTSRRQVTADLRIGYSRPAIDRTRGCRIATEGARAHRAIEQCCSRRETSSRGPMPPEAHQESRFRGSFEVPKGANLMSTTTSSTPEATTTIWNLDPVHSIAEFK